MRTLLYASLSANGFIVRPNAGHEIPREVLTDFHAHVHRAGNVVIGRQTFLLLRSSGSSEAFRDIDIVVLSATLDETPGAIVARSPDEALNHVTARGHQTALIGGGALTYSALLERGLVDELHINITPTLAGDGLTMSPHEHAETQLVLVDTKRLGDQIVQLHHRVQR